MVLAVLAGAGVLFIYLFADPKLIARQLGEPEEVLELVGASLTSIAAVVAAFRIHVRGRTLPWRATPLVLFAAWQSLSIIHCLDVPLDKPAEQILYGHSPDCFLFILAASIPVALVLFPLLRLHRTQLGWSASAMTGLAISSFAVLLLQFFHNVEMNLGDWSIHFLAMGVVVGSSAYVGQVLSSR
ncbi:MAG: hypothetical protein K0Q70_2683 [Rhodospirillales bacterium]|nr:hypothetical protein [Rhodospirillales bacterium]